MDKLIDLLNQFEKEKKSGYTRNKIDNYDNCVYGVDIDGETEITMYSDLYSKYYGFIKWLVDKDKINTNYITGYSIYGTDEYFTPYENLLMDLARFEEPLNYLSSLLK